MIKINYLMKTGINIYEKYYYLINNVTPIPKQALYTFHRTNNTIQIKEYSYDILIYSYNFGTFSL